MKQYLSLPIWALLAGIVTACGGSGSSATSEPDAPTSESEDPPISGGDALNSFRTSPIELPAETASDPSAVPTLGTAYYNGEIQLDYVDYQRDDPIDPDFPYVERSYGDLTLRIRLADGIVSGHVEDVRQEDGTPRPGKLEIASSRDRIVRDANDFLGPIDLDTSSDAVNFFASIFGELDSDTAREAQINGSLRGLFLGDDGGIVAGEGGAAIFADDGFDEIEFFFVADAGEPPNDNTPTPVLNFDLPAYQLLSEEFGNLSADVSAAANLGTMPNSGAAVYSGIASIPVHNGRELLGDVVLDVSFSNSEVSGTATNFVRDDGAVLSGQIRILDDSPLMGFMTLEDGRLLEVFGTLNGTEDDYVIYLNGLGGFEGTTGEFIDAELVGSVTFDGEILSVDDGRLIAGR